MSQKIKGLFLLICAVGVLGLAMSFFSRGTPIEVQVPMVTKQMVEENQAKLKNEAEQRQMPRPRANVPKRKHGCGSVRPMSSALLWTVTPAAVLRAPKA